MFARRLLLAFVLPSDSFCHMSEISSKIVLNVVGVSSELLGCHFTHSYNIRLFSIKDGVHAMYTSPPLGISSVDKHEIIMGRNFLHLLLGK